MKKKTLTVAVICALAGSLMLGSCIGSFNLTTKLLGWNKQISNKFVNELVFVAFWILPVYEVSGLADLLVLNSIEFWGGQNPVAKGKKIIDGQDGKYLVVCDGKGYTIKSLNDGSVVRLDFNFETQSWYYSAEGREPVLLFTYVDDTHLKLPCGDGQYKVFETSDAGLMAYQQVAMPQFWASR